MSINKIIRLLAVIALVTGCHDNPPFTTGCDGSYDGTLDYQGRAYKYKAIGTQTWMIENLACLPEV
ncbi:MAG: hypothetical protein V2A67_11870, partial [Bacteroidota bacterium]